MSKRSVSLGAALAVLPLFGLGCNPVASVQDKIGQTVANSVVNQATGGQVNVDQNNNAVSFTDNKTGGSMAFGDNVSIPSDFPKDAPIYPGAKAVGVIMSRTDDHSSSATLKTDDDVKTVVAWYEGQLKSPWKQDSSFTASGTEIRSYSKDDAQLALTITPGDNGKGSVISIAYTPKGTTGTAPSTGSN